MDPSAKELLMHRTGWTTNYSFRSYETIDFSNDSSEDGNKVGSVFSEWIPMVQDTYYYIEAQAMNYETTGHATFGFEV